MLGFVWADGHLDRRVAVRMVVGGGLVLAALVALPSYPLSMVGTNLTEASNTYPPSVALVVLTVVHVGVVVLATPALRRLTARPAVWAAVTLAGRGAVTVYLWHLLGMGLFIAGAALFAPQLLHIEPLTTAWWVTRPLWFAALALTTAPLVAAAVRLETSLGSVDAPSTSRVALAAGIATVGCAGLVFDGVGALWAVAAVLAAALVGRWVPARAAAR